jgi:hypothetical protein
VSSFWTPGGERAVPAPASHDHDHDHDHDDEALSPEDQLELEAELAAMQEELARTPVAVVVANHAVGLFQLAALHLNQRPPNLAEGRLAIDAMAALVDGLTGRLDDQEPTLRDALAQLRLAFVELSSRGE